MGEQAALAAVPGKGGLSCDELEFSTTTLTDGTMLLWPVRRSSRYVVASMVRLRYDGPHRHHFSAHGRAFAIIGCAGTSLLEH